MNINSGCEELINVKVGDLFYSTRSCAVAGFNNDDVYVKPDDILVYLGKSNRSKDNYECHVFFHQNSTMYIGWTIVAIHYIDEYIKKCI